MHLRLTYNFATQLRMASFSCFHHSSAATANVHVSLCACVVLRGWAAGQLGSFVRTGNHAAPQLHAYASAAQFLGEGPRVLSPALPQPLTQFLAHRDYLVTAG